MDAAPGDETCDGSAAGFVLRPGCECRGPVEYERDQAEGMIRASRRGAVATSGDPGLLIIQSSPPIRGTRHRNARMARANFPQFHKRSAENRPDMTQGTGAWSLGYGED